MINNICVNTCPHNQKTRYSHHLFLPMSLVSSFTLMIHCARSHLTPSSPCKSSHPYHHHTKNTWHATQQHHCQYCIVCILYFFYFCTLPAASLSILHVCILFALLSIFQWLVLAKGIWQQYNASKSTFLCLCKTRVFPELLSYSIFAPVQN